MNLNHDGDTDNMYPKYLNFYNERKTGPSKESETSWPFIRIFWFFF